MHRILAALLLTLFFSTPTFAQGPRALRISFVTSITAHGLDLFSSRCAVVTNGQPPTCQELNPLLKKLSDKPLAFAGVKMGSAAALQLIPAYVARQGHPKLAFWFNVAQTVTFTTVALRNHRHSR